LSWGTLILGDDYDSTLGETDIDRFWVTKQLMSHPLLNSDDVLGEAFQVTPAFTKSLTGVVNPTPYSNIAGDKNWFQTSFGVSANELVKQLRRKRRVYKQYKGEIDDSIALIRMLKSMEVDEVLKSLPWCSDYIPAIRGLGVSDRNLDSLRKFGAIREISLKQACIQWDNANDVITKLAVLGDFDGEQQTLWTEAVEKRKEAKKMWRHTLHQTDNLSKFEKQWLSSTATLLQHDGLMGSRQIVEHLLDEHDARNKGLTPQRMGALLKMYGNEYDIVKSGRRWGSETMDYDLILKNPWAYTAGFLDADGYITITKRGEPRAGMIATGTRGRLHCEQMHKMVGCGILQLDLKVHKNSRRSQHRLQFYSANDLRRLLKGVLPHLKLKETQANAVLELLDLRGRSSDVVKSRREDLYRIVKWANWQDVKGHELLDEWKVDEREVSSWSAVDPEVIRLVDDAHSLVGDV